MNWTSCWPPGEQITIALFSMAVKDMGSEAVSMTGYQAGIITDSNYGQARINWIETLPIMEKLHEGKIVVVAGFQGYDDEGNITTLGRGGSDTTAVALAAALGADMCEIYTDVEGVFTTDPNVYSKARKLEKDQLRGNARDGQHGSQGASSAVRRIRHEVPRADHGPLLFHRCSGNACHQGG